MFCMFIPNLLPAMHVTTGQQNLLLNKKLFPFTHNMLRSLGLSCWCLSEIFSFYGLRYNLNEDPEQKHHLHRSVSF